MWLIQRKLRHLYTMWSNFCLGSYISVGNGKLPLPPKGGGACLITVHANSWTGTVRTGCVRRYMSKCVRVQDTQIMTAVQLPQTTAGQRCGTCHITLCPPLLSRFTAKCRCGSLHLSDLIVITQTDLACHQWNSKPLACGSRRIVCAISIWKWYVHRNYNTV